MKAYWTEERIVAEFRVFAAHTGRQPVANEARSPLPSMSTVQKVFGSWSNACIAAGYEGWPRGGEAMAKDEETLEAMARIEAGETLTDVAGEFGITGQALGRRIARYRRTLGLEPLVLRPGRRSPCRAT